MRPKHFPPTFKASHFHCVHCGVDAHQHWATLTTQNSTWYGEHPTVAVCNHCGQRTYWFFDRLVFPADSAIEPGHPDLPEDCKSDYEEARSIFNRSPRAAAALIRLAIQKLMPALGEKGKNINDDIKSLVTKGLPQMVQQALDICRVVGNNAVHPGEINLNDTPEVAESLFRVLNIIVEEMITKPAEVQALYNSLPPNTLNAIAKRDQPAP